MFSHISVGSNDLARSQAFYDALMATLGKVRLPYGGVAQDYLLYGTPDEDYPHLDVTVPFDGLPATWGNGFHIAFSADSTAQVEAFHAAALSAGGRDDGAPGIRAAYADDYFGAYVRDPDGNKLQAVYYQNGRTPGPQGAQISHITLGYHDLAVSAAFYAACLSTIGLTRLPAEEADESEAAFGYDGTRTPVVFVQAPFDGRPATWGNGTHVAFAAKTRAEVHAFHEAALAAGGVCEGPPGPRPQYSQRYYAAYMRDPMGQKLQIVTRNTDG